MASHGRAPSDTLWTFWIRFSRIHPGIRGRWNEYRTGYLTLGCRKRAVGRGVGSRPEQPSKPAVPVRGAVGGCGLIQPHKPPATLVRTNQAPPFFTSTKRKRVSPGPLAMTHSLALRAYIPSGPFSILGPSSYHRLGRWLLISIRTTPTVATARPFEIRPDDFPTAARSYRRSATNCRP